VPPPDPKPVYWSRDASELTIELGTGANGLSAKEAVERLGIHGPNVVMDQARLTAARLLLKQFESPLVIILVFGAVISLALREWVDASIILVIVLGSTLLVALKDEALWHLAERTVVFMGNLIRWANIYPAH
jgi:Mg2+-importing ATPase